MEKKTFSLVLFIVLSNTINLFSQNTAGVTGETLWIKSEDHSQPAQRNSTDQSNTYFNFNPIFSAVRKKENLLYKNILKAKYSLFAVFKSDVKDENTILRLNANGREIQITNNQVISSENTAYNKKVDVTNGIVLSYFVSTVEKKNRKKNQLLIENLSSANSGNSGRNDLMELIYYPRILEIPEKQKVESYLSIKYGISLLGNTDYVNSEGGKIWDYESNKAYNNRVTGIGRDDALALNQKQSGNAKKDGLYIGLGTIETTNGKNTSSLPDKSFLLWGDNGASASITAGRNDQGDVKKMKRVWKTQNSPVWSSDEFPTQIMLNKKEMSLAAPDTPDKKDESIWLVIDRNSSPVFDYQNAEYYKQSAEDNENILFNGIVWDTDKSGSDSFTFIKAPDFFTSDAVNAPDYNVSEEGNMNLKTAGGKASPMPSDNGWVIYPNPAKHDQPFTIRFDLKEPSEVTVAIYEFAGKLIKTEKLGLIKELQYTDTLSINGTFMVAVTTNGITRSAKLIIQ